MKIETTTLVSDLLEQEEAAAQVLAQAGLHCIGCASMSGETIEEAALEHGLDPVLLVRKLNLYLNHQI